jgi:hypothetical protein
MVIIGNTLISDDVIEKRFCCDLAMCKGACCIEGDSGAPLHPNEILAIGSDLDKIVKLVPDDAKQLIEREGFHEIDSEGDVVTKCLDDGRCCFVTFDEKAQMGCAIETAYHSGESATHKPLSCHLYPIRLKEMKTYTAVNYHDWSICNPALKKGNSLGMPLYVFAKDALIRSFGQEWFNVLQEIAEKKLENGAEETE